MTLTDLDACSCDDCGRFAADLSQAEAKVRAASQRRRVLPIGSSRARVTTANARWSTACEALDRVLMQIAARVHS